MCCPSFESLDTPEVNCCQGQCKTHVLKELEDEVHQCSVRLIFLVPRCPTLNHIEVNFRKMKHWIQKCVNLVLSLHSEIALDVSVPVREKGNALGLCDH